MRVAVERDDLTRSPSTRGWGRVGTVLVERGKEVEVVVLVVDVPPVVGANFLVSVVVDVLLDVDLGALLLIVIIVFVIVLGVFVLGILVRGFHLVVVVVAVVVPVVDGGVLLLAVALVVDHFNLLLFVIVHEVDVRLAVGVLVGFIVVLVLFARLVLLARLILAGFVVVLVVAVHRLEHLTGNLLELRHLLRVVLRRHRGGSRQPVAPFVALPTITSLDRARRVRSIGGGLGGGGLPRALREPRVRRRRLGRGRRPRHHLEWPQDRVDEHRRCGVIEVHPVQRRAHGREKVRVLHAPLQVTGVPPLEVLALAVVLGTRRGPRGFTPRVRQESVDQIHKRSSGSRAFASVLHERIRRFQRDAHLVKHPASRLRRSDSEREEKVRGSFAAVPSARRGPAVLVGFA